MDSTAEELVLDNEGVCNFCHQAQNSLMQAWSEKHNLLGILNKIKQGGQYDCLIGLSGGLDSSYALHKAVEFGLKPLCFSIDNGWNDAKADENIMKLVEGLKVPFYRYTIDLKKFRKLQASFLQSGTKNLEIPTDHILMASSYELASLYGIKWILSGGNVSSESIMPASWGYQARDLVHIKDIYQRFTGEKLSGLPTCSLLKFNYYKWIKRIRVFYLLDYLEYNRAEAIKVLKNKYGWEDYGAKHEESIWTKWFQNFYLYEKFGIDKRKAHLSSLINSGQITRDEAMVELEKNPEYPKLGLEKRVMDYKIRDYSYYKTDERLFNFISKVIRKCRF